MGDGADPLRELTGHADGPALAPPPGLLPTLEATRATLLDLAPGAEVPPVLDLLTRRARLRGFTRRGRTSANGSCRLLPTADGWAALNLARPTDVELLPALFERRITGDPWAAATDAVAGMTGGELVERAALLAVPAAALPPPGPRPTPEPFRLHRLGEPGVAGGLVLDLSAMWAGPLCAHLLGRAGLGVVKVEDEQRPDGARHGDPELFAWLHHGHESVTLDFRSPAGRRALAQLVGQADVVIESSRPRALAQLGIDAAAVVAARPGVTWVSITGYGRDDPRVAFGDDAAVAAGLVAYDCDGDPVFCADAVADPITGLVAAVATLTSWAEGGGHLAEVAMVDAAGAAVC
jgi:hypothetical protein